MSTPTAHQPSAHQRSSGHTTERQRRRAVAAAQRAFDARRRRRNSLLIWGVGLGVIAAIVAVMMATSRATSTGAVRAAPDFTLTDTNGTPVHLADYRGKTVVLYFSEGAGCQACITQMADIERNPQFRASGIAVLPIVMNTPDQIRADMKTEGVQTPFLIDTDGSVSRAYGTLGKGMHAGLPGHSFVLIDAKGQQRWYGEYPSMFLSATDLLAEVNKHLR